MLYLARHVRLTMDPVRVIKFIKPEFCHDEKLVKRLAREVEVTAALSQNNEHIVRVYDDFGEFPDLGHYFVMEHLKGEDLYDLLEREELLPLDGVFHIFRQICIAIRDAHHAQVIHRDLKPQNIFLITRHQDKHFVKVIDFGIAKTLANEQQTALTQGIIGTPEYMAPEQCSGHPVDSRTDIYALGSILYRMLVGHTPFLPPERKGTFSIMELAVAQMMEEPKPPSMRRKELASIPGLDEFVLRSLAKKSEERFGSIDELLLALDKVEATMGQSTPARVGRHTSELHSTTAAVHAEPAGQQGPSLAGPATQSGEPVAAHPHLLATGVPLDAGGLPSSLDVTRLEQAPGCSLEPPSSLISDEFRSVEVGHTATGVPPKPSALRPALAEPIQPSPKRWAVVATLLVLLLAGGGLWWGMKDSKSTPTNRHASPPRRVERQVPPRREQPKPVVDRGSAGPHSRTPTNSYDTDDADDTDDSDDADVTDDKPVVRGRLRQRRGRRRVQRRVRPRTPRRRPVGKPSGFPGCSDIDSGLVYRFDLMPADLRFEKSSYVVKYKSRWACLERGKAQGRSMIKIFRDGYDSCLFRLPSLPGRYRITLSKNKGLGGLERGETYCLKR